MRKIRKREKDIRDSREEVFDCEVGNWELDGLMLGVLSGHGGRGEEEDKVEERCSFDSVGVLTPCDPPPLSGPTLFPLIKFQNICAHSPVHSPVAVDDDAGAGGARGARDTCAGRCTGYSLLILLLITPMPSPFPQPAHPRLSVLDDSASSAIAFFRPTFATIVHSDYAHAENWRARDQRKARHQHTSPTAHSRLADSIPSRLARMAVPEYWNISWWVAVVRYSIASPAPSPLIVCITSSSLLAAWFGSLTASMPFCLSVSPVFLPTWLPWGGPLG